MNKDDIIKAHENFRTATANATKAAADFAEGYKKVKEPKKRRLMGFGLDVVRPIVKQFFQGTCSTSDFQFRVMDLTKSQGRQAFTHIMRGAPNKQAARKQLEHKFPRPRFRVSTKAKRLPMKDLQEVQS